MCRMALLKFRFLHVGHLLQSYRLNRMEPKARQSPFEAAILNTINILLRVILTFPPPHIIWGDKGVLELVLSEEQFI